MKLAFELVNANGWPYSAVDHIIGWWTQSRFCHAEVVFDRIQENLGFSATLREGVRFKTRDFTDQKCWVLVDVPVTGPQEQDAYDYAKTLVGRKYNVNGILRFGLGPVHTPNDRDFCSQTSMLVLQHVGLEKGLPPDRIDPGFLYDISQGWQ